MNLLITKRKKMQTMRKNWPFNYLALLFNLKFFSPESLFVHTFHNIRYLQ